MRKKQIASVIFFILLGVVSAAYLVVGIISDVKYLNDVDFEMLFLPAFPFLESIMFIYVSCSNSLTARWLWKKNDSVGDAEREVVMRVKTLIFLAVLFYVFLGISLLPAFDALKYALAGVTAVVSGIAFALFFAALKDGKTEAIEYLKKTSENERAYDRRKQAKKDAAKSEIMKILNKTADKTLVEKEEEAERRAQTEQAEKTARNDVNETSIPAVADLHEREQIEKEKIMPTKPETTETTANEKPTFDDGFSGDKGSYNASGESDEETKKRRGF